MRVLVSGGAGFIGSCLAEHLLRDGHDVSILDDLNDFYSPARKRANLSAVRSAGAIAFYEGDICDSETIERVIQEQRPEAIVHLAARVGVRPSLEQPLLYARVNVEGTTRMLEAARQTGVRKFVFASSSSIYGVAGPVPFSESNHMSLPVSPYAATKIAGEKICYSYSHLYGMKTICLRFFTVYGPRQRPDMAIHKFTRLMLEGKPIPVFGDGSTARDCTFIEDIVEGIVAALHYECAYEIFNLGTSHAVTLRTLVETLSVATGMRPKIEELPDQPGDVSITCADISKAQRLLGYKPKTLLVEGIRKFVDWYLFTGLYSD